MSGGQQLSKIIGAGIPMPLRVALRDGPNESPVFALVPEAGALTLLGVGGRSRVEAAAVAFFAAHLAGGEIGDFALAIRDSVDFAEAMIAEIDARTKKQREEANGSK